MQVPNLRLFSSSIDFFSLVLLISAYLSLPIRLPPPLVPYFLALLPVSRIPRRGRSNHWTEESCFLLCLPLCLFATLSLQHRIIAKIPLKKVRSDIDHRIGCSPCVWDFCRWYIEVDWMKGTILQSKELFNPLLWDSGLLTKRFPLTWLSDLSTEQPSILTV